MRQLIIISILFLYCTFLTFCTSHSLQRELTAVNKITSKMKDGTFFIYSDCNIYIKELSMKDWKRLLEYSVFINKKYRPYYRIPKLHFFHVIYENRLNRPIKISSVSIKYGKKSQLQLTYKKLRAYLKSPLYKMIRFKSLLTRRRIFIKDEENYQIKKINYEDSVPLYLNYIVPYDKIALIIAFNRVPIQYRTFTISITMTDGKKKKEVDFVFKRFEYRSYGKHFRKKIDKKNEEPL